MIPQISQSGKIRKGNQPLLIQESFFIKTTAPPLDGTCVVEPFHVNDLIRLH